MFLQPPRIDYLACRMLCLSDDKTSRVLRHSTQLPSTKIPDSPPERLCVIPVVFGTGKTAVRNMRLEDSYDDLDRAGLLPKFVKVHRYETWISPPWVKSCPEPGIGNAREARPSLCKVLESGTNSLLKWGLNDLDVRGWYN